MLFDGYPPTAFHFVVGFAGVTLPPVPDFSFQEVRGLEAGFDVEEVVEGGENTFVHKLPKGIKQSNLTLKRGMGTIASGLVVWCKMIMDAGLATPMMMSAPIEPKEVVVMLLNGYHVPIATWHASNAYPVKWEIGAFDAMKNEIAVETVELAYNKLTRVM